MISIVSNVLCPDCIVTKPWLMLTFHHLDQLSIDGDRRSASVVADRDHGIVREGNIACHVTLVAVFYNIEWANENFTQKRAQREVVLYALAVPASCIFTRCSPSLVHPPCNVETKTTSSPACNSYASWPSSSQSASLMRTKIPGRLRSAH